MTLYRITVQRCSTVYEDTTTEIEAATPQEALKLARQEMDEDGFDWREYHADTESDSYDWAVWGDWTKWTSNEGSKPLLTASGKYGEEDEACESS